MKTKLNLTIESDPIPLSKKHAQSKGISVSQLVEGVPRQIISKKTDSQENGEVNSRPSRKMILAIKN